MFNEVNDAVDQAVGALVLCPPGWVMAVGWALGVLYAIFATCWTLVRFLLPWAQRAVRRQSLLVRSIAYVAVVLWAIIFMLVAMVMFGVIGKCLLYALVAAWFPCLVILTMTLITRSVIRRTS